jgi:hypothetical protein
MSGLAPAQVKDMARRDSLLQAAQADLELIMLRLELARASADEVLRKARVGAAGPEAVAAALADLREREAQVVRGRLNIEEIRATSQPPRDELTAPLAGDRDFVAQRLQLELSAAQERLTAAERALAETARRVNIGTVSESSLAEAEVELTRARAELATLLDRRSLRREFLEKGAEAGALARRHEATRLRLDLEVAQAALRQARLRLESVQKQHSIGTASRLELMRAEVEMQERELELKQLLLRRERLGELRR